MARVKIVLGILAAVVLVLLVTNHGPDAIHLLHALGKGISNLGSFLHQLFA